MVGLASRRALPAIAGSKVVDGRVRPGHDEMQDFKLRHDLAFTVIDAYDLADYEVRLRKDGADGLLRGRWPAVAATMPQDIQIEAMAPL